MFTDYLPITDDEVETIHKTLRDMKTLDTGRRVVGVNGYNAGTPVPEEELRAYEEKCGIVLPVDYRSFMNRIGWGTGPGVGLGALNAVVDLQAYDLQRPFPYTEKTVLDIPFDDTWSGEIYPGAMCIGYDGAYSLTLLVVNGPAYGTVWELEENDEDKVFRPSGRTFGQWYAAWLGFLTEVAAPRIRSDAVVAEVRTGMRRSELMALCDPTGANCRESKSSGGYYLIFDNLLSYMDMRPPAPDEADGEYRVKQIVRQGISGTEWIFGSRPLSQKVGDSLLGTW